VYGSLISLSIQEPGMPAFDTQNFLFNGQDLESFATEIEQPGGVKDFLRSQTKRIRDLQNVLYADGRRSLLLVFQGMDCSGKDSTIKHVLSGVNPQGVHVANFKAPSKKEIAHSYLWRYWGETPERGMIGVFNRSHYEEVLVMRVHPEFFAQRQIPHPELSEEFWIDRIADLTNFESHLHDTGTKVVKFYLHLSKAEQKRRLLARIDRPHKNWKFNPADLSERQLWGDYRKAFQKAIEHSHSKTAPWYIIPADDKPTMRALIAQIVADTLDGMEIRVPETAPEVAAELQACKEHLLNED